MAVSGHASHQTLAETLERQRLEHRDRRLAAVLHELQAHEQRHSHEGGESSSRHLQSAIRDFQAAQREVHVRLRQLG